MNYDRLKSSVMDMEMSDDMRYRIIRNCHSIMSKHTVRKTLRKKTIVLVAAIAVCIMFSVPVLAASIPYDLLYSFSPATAQFFKPVNMSCEDSGIYMKVISAYIHGDTAEIYITLQDLTGNRIDQTTDLFDSYSINTPFGCSAHCENVSYDEETKTATFLITMTQWGEKDIGGNKITFQLREFLSNKHKFNDSLSEVDLKSLSASVDTFAPDENNIRGGGGIRYEDFSNGFVALAPSSKQHSPVNGVTITAIGYINGYLHVQIDFENIRETDNHGYVYFQNEAGEEIESIASIGFEDNEQQHSYDEYIFSIPQEEIADYTMYGYFVTADSLTRGNWEVTFPLEDKMN